MTPKNAHDNRSVSRLGPAHRRLTRCLAAGDANAADYTLASFDNMDAAAFL